MADNNNNIKLKNVNSDLDIKKTLNDKLCYNIFEFRQNLGIKEQNQSLSALMDYYFFNLKDNTLSELQSVQMMSQALLEFKYKKNVREFISKINEDVSKNKMVYELADLQHQLQTKNHGNLYIHPINIIHRLINSPNDKSRMVGIVNELSNYSWIPEVRNFVVKYANDPFHKENYISVDSLYEKVYTIYEKVHDGALIFVKDKWFLLGENSIEVCTDLTKHIKDNNKLNELLLISEGIRQGKIEDSILKLKLDENLSVGISVSDKADAIFINDEAVNEQTTLDLLFSSPLIPESKRGYYSLFECAKKNKEKFIDFEKCIKVYNRYGVRESYIFNYKDMNYVYSTDPVYDNVFLYYEKVEDLVENIRKIHNYDVGFFFRNKIADETMIVEKVTRRLEKLKVELEDVEDSIGLLKQNKQLFIEEAANGEDQYNDLLVELFMSKDSIEEKIERLSNKITYKNPKFA